jgi:hypothetical protein
MSDQRVFADPRVGLAQIDAGFLGQLQTPRSNLQEIKQTDAACLQMQ